MNRSQRQTPTRFRTQPDRKTDDLSEQRYADLLKSASVFFASAFVASDDERQAAIIEINERMVRYGLTVQDLL
jgi:heme oxygenase